MYIWVYLYLILLYILNEYSKLLYKHMCLFYEYKILYFIVSKSFYNQCEYKYPNNGIDFIDFANISGVITRVQVGRYASFIACWPLMSQVNRYLVLNRSPIKTSRKTLPKLPTYVAYFWILSFGYSLWPRPRVEPQATP